MLRRLAALWISSIMPYLRHDAAIIQAARGAALPMQVGVRYLQASKPSKATLMKYLRMQFSIRHIVSYGSRLCIWLTCLGCAGLLTSLCRHPSAGSAMRGTSMTHAIWRGSRTCKCITVSLKLAKFERPDEPLVRHGVHSAAIVLDHCSAG